VFLVVAGCNSGTKSKTLNANDVRTELNKLGLDSEVQMFTSNDDIKFNIDYKGIDLNSFFIDSESNNLIIALVCHRLYKSLDPKLRSISFSIRFQNYKEYYQIELNKEQLKKFNSSFENNPLFEKFVVYSLRNMKYLLVTESTQLIGLLQKRYSENFSHKGSFWKLLQGYSEGCKNKIKSQPYNDFIFFVQKMIKVKEIESEGGFDTFDYFIERCKF
jgi:hypothetical protein